MSVRQRATALLRRQADADFELALDHRFFAEASAGTLDEQVFRRYLEIEYSFVDTAARCVGRAVHVAPSATQRRHLADALHGLLHDQFDYFQAVASRMGAQLSIEPPNEGSAAALHRHALDVAVRGEYLPLIASSLGAEWLYQTWCSRAVGLGVERSPELDSWIRLHVDEGFVGHVEWLRQELDAGLIEVSPNSPTFQECLEAFRGTLKAEIAFHDEAYVTSGTTRAGS